MNRLSKYLERILPETTAFDELFDVAKVMSGETLLTKQQADKIADKSPYLDSDLIVQLNRDDHAAWKAKKPRKSGQPSSTTKSPMPGAKIPARPTERF